MNESYFCRLSISYAEIKSNSNLHRYIAATPHWIARADRVQFILKMLTNQTEISLIWISPQEDIYGLVSKKL